MAIISAVTWQATGTFLVALEEEFGWSRTLLSGAFSIARAEGALMGPVEGIITDRMGARRTMLVGFFICAIGFLLFTQVNHPVTFYIVFIVIVSGAGLGGYIPLATLINRWFSRRRTMATSVLMVGGSIGGTMVPLLAWGIVAHGWRWVVGGIGVFMLVAVLPIVSVIRDRPEDLGLRPDGDPVDAEQDVASPRNISSQRPPASPQRGPELTAREALRTWTFWAISISHAGTGIAMTTLSMHLVPHLRDQDMSLPMAGMVVLIVTSVSASFQLIGGWLGDRIDKRIVIFVFMTVHGVSLLYLLTVDSFNTAVIFAVIAGVGHGGRAPAATAIRGDYFGQRAFGTILGLSMIPMNIGGIVIPLMAGLIFDIRGSYTITFLMLAAISFLGAFFILTIRPASRVTAPR